MTNHVAKVQIDMGQEKSWPDSVMHQDQLCESIKAALLAQTKQYFSEAVDVAMAGEVQSVVTLTKD